MWVTANKLAPRFGLHTNGTAISRSAILNVACKILQAHWRLAFTSREAAKARGISLFFKYAEQG